MSENNEVEIISTYSRKQAIEDGVLVEVPENLLNSVGIKFPVAVTATVWEEYIKAEELESEQDLTEKRTRGISNRVPCGQDTVGRLWDVLWVFMMNARGHNQDTVHFKVIFLSTENEKTVQKHVTLKAVIGPGDQGEPVITIMKPEED